MFKRPMPKPKAQRGISLVEVMVGMAIGLLASLVIFKAFTSSETFRRNVGGAGAVAATSISRPPHRPPPCRSAGRREPDRAGTPAGANRAAGVGR